MEDSKSGGFVLQGQLLALPLLQRLSFMVLLWYMAHHMEKGMLTQPRSLLERRFCC